MEDYKLSFSRLGKLSAGERACLRRCCGTMLQDADGQAVLVFYRWLPYEVPACQEAQWFAAACTACLWDAPGNIPIEKCFAKMRTESNTLEKRIAALLDMGWDADGFFLAKLMRLVKMARQKGYDIDCGRLLEDLIGWNSERRHVQRKWAKTLYLPEQAQERRQDHVV